MLRTQIPQIVTSQDCQACRVCCFFNDPGGDWPPRLTPEDAAALLKCAPQGAWRDGCDRIALKDVGGVHYCSLLDEKGYSCQVYASRPFECRLYPFVISREKNGFKVYAHLSCPVVGQAQADPRWEARAAAIRDFFTQADVKKFVHENAASFPDYSHFGAEVEEVFAFDPGGELWAQKAGIEAAFLKRPRRLSAMAFVNLFAWQGFFDLDVDDIEGHKCVFAAQAAGIFLYWPPLGAGIPSSVIDACFEKMRRINRGGSLTRIENVAEDEVAFFDSKKYCVEPRGQEYVYRRADIALLQGQGFKSRRGEVNAFERLSAGTYTFRPYVARDFNACALLFDRWLDGRLQKHDNEIYRHMLCENRGVHRLVLSYENALGLVGRVVEIRGEIVAYTFGYPLNDDTFCVLFEITDLAVKGLAAFVFKSLCEDHALESFTWVNAMDDFEADELGKTKMLWRPARLEPIYSVTMRV